MEHCWLCLSAFSPLVLPVSSHLSSTPLIFLPAPVYSRRKILQWSPSFSSCHQRVVFAVFLCSITNHFERSDILKGTCDKHNQNTDPSVFIFLPLSLTHIHFPSLF